jgi:hypothetical protein
MEPVAASLVTLNIRNSISATVWAVEPKPLPGVIVLPGGGGPAPLRWGVTPSTTPNLAPVQVLFQLDFVESRTGQWLKGIGITGR